MNRKQIIILVVGIVLIFVSELFPHWYYEDVDTSAKRTAGYHFITTTPAKKSADELRLLFAYSNEYPRRFPESVILKVNSKRQLLQQVFLGLFMLGLCLICKNNLSKQVRNAGVATILLGLLPLALWFLDLATRGV